MTKHLFSAIVLAASAHLSAAIAGQGVEEQTITFAQIAALEGPASALGTGMRTGIVAAFEEANRRGGINGRVIKLDSFDDGYEPENTAKHLRRLIEENRHIGLIGSVGTPTALVAQPIATEANLPLIAPFTGAGFLRDPALKNVFNVRASYDAETESWIDYLVDQRGYDKIAILYQDDGFGRVGLAGVQKALEARDMTLAATGTYTRNTLAVKVALLNIRKAKPQAVVMVGAYKPIAEFIRLASKLRFRPEFVNISFVGSTALADDLQERGLGVIISQVVPFPWDTSLPLIQDYQDALDGLGKGDKPGFVSLEGYIAGRFALEAVKAAGKTITQQSYLKALQQIRTLDLNGLQLSYGPNDNQGMDQVFLTRISSNSTFTSLSK